MVEGLGPTKLAGTPLIDGETFDKVFLPLTTASRELVEKIAAITEKMLTEVMKDPALFENPGRRAELICETTAETVNVAFPKTIGAHIQATVRDLDEK
ncbi:MAG: hypothetical protein A2289_02670 [Deltaproteobacteria bacterium RIFOXYA12_FULL_58_15]|nr:MAG: hypothetical protein A2289_02670 [Deltaproteobacteria bacterium RIFOXYA12_FULL_58_15]OGR13460.1 MAG: hypothetical protein A2341_28055 [Deltaproteobacteria bacterium RIFOXYB12_FULL_58_9]